MPRITPFAGLFRTLAAPITSLRTAATSATATRPITTLISSSIIRPSTSAHAHTPLIPSLPTAGFSPILQQVRFGSYGAEYQPSQRKRKRKHGFLSRQRGGKDGLATLRRRRKQGRRFLSH